MVYVDDEGEEMPDSEFDSHGMIEKQDEGVGGSATEEQLYEEYDEVSCFLFIISEHESKRRYKRTWTREKAPHESTRTKRKRDWYP